MVIEEQRQCCIEQVAESWVLKAQGEEAGLPPPFASPELHCSPFSLDPRSVHALLGKG